MRYWPTNKALLLVLEHPFLPLENNSAELGTRVQARIRDINLQTARKLGVNIYQYIYDRVSKKFEMPSLAEIIIATSNPTLNSA